MSRIASCIGAHGSTPQSKNLCVGIQRHIEYTVKSPPEKRI
jgi:hypothetical protein